MDRDPMTPKKNEPDPEFQDRTFCWKELLDRAFIGWEPADQTLERIIDRMESR